MLAHLTHLNSMLNTSKNNINKKKEETKDRNSRIYYFICYLFSIESINGSVIIGMKIESV